MLINRFWAISGFSYPKLSLFVNVGKQKSQVEPIKVSKNSTLHFYGKIFFKSPNEFALKVGIE